MGETKRDGSAAPGRQDPIVRKTYHHGSVPSALHAAARQSLEGGDPEQLGLRDLARRIGVSPTAAYRHFTNKEDLMASVAAEGFQELTEAMKVAEDGAQPVVDIGLAYVEFALSHPGLFRLMFGPLLTDREKHEGLRDSAAAALAVVETLGRGASDAGRRASAMVSYSAIHGLANLSLMNVLSKAEARALAQDVLLQVQEMTVADRSESTESAPTDFAAPGPAPSAG